MKSIEDKVYQYNFWTLNSVWDTITIIGKDNDLLSLKRLWEVESLLKMKRNQLLLNKKEIGEMK